MIVFVDIKGNNFSIQIFMVSLLVRQKWSPKTEHFLHFICLFLSGKIILWTTLTRKTRTVSAQELLHFGLISLHRPQQRWQFHVVFIHRKMQARATGPGAEQQAHHALFSKMFTADVKF